jgi:hypothetical protein
VHEDIRAAGRPGNDKDRAGDNSITRAIDSGSGDHLLLP